MTIGGKHTCGGLRRFSKYRRPSNNSWTPGRKDSLISFDNPFRRRSTRDSGRDRHSSNAYARYLRGESNFSEKGLLSLRDV